MGEKKGGLFNIVTVLVITGIIVGLVYVFVPDLTSDIFNKMDSTVDGVNLGAGQVCPGTKTWDVAQGKCI